jgi:Na+/H+ antiporter NhaD/arsenite permease-like protein
MLFIIAILILSFFFGFIMLIAVIFAAIIRKILLYLLSPNNAYDQNTNPRRKDSPHRKDNIIEAEYTIIDDSSVTEDEKK